MAGAAPPHESEIPSRVERGSGHVPSRPEQRVEPVTKPRPLRALLGFVPPLRFVLGLPLLRLQSDLPRQARWHATHVGWATHDEQVGRADAFPIGLVHPHAVDRGIRAGLPYSRPRSPRPPGACSRTGSRTRSRRASHLLGGLAPLQTGSRHPAAQATSRAGLWTVRPLSGTCNAGGSESNSSSRMGKPRRGIVSSRSGGPRAPQGSDRAICGTGRPMPAEEARGETGHGIERRPS